MTLYGSRGELIKKRLRGLTISLVSLVVSVMTFLLLKNGDARQKIISQV
jgi:hypothetical protein